MIQAKGINYSLKKLIPSMSSDSFIDGDFITLYLSPGDYHRIHSPADGLITGYFHIAGRLFTVQDYMVKGMKGLFTANERLVSYISTDSGKIAVVKVGAMNVGKISISHADIITNKNLRKTKEVLYKENENISIKKGEELGIFHLGSTVILLFEKNMIEFSNITKKQKIRVGEKIASLIRQV